MLSFQNCVSESRGTRKNKDFIVQQTATQIYLKWYFHESPSSKYIWVIYFPIAQQGSRLGGFPSHPGRGEGTRNVCFDSYPVISWIPLKSKKSHINHRNKCFSCPPRAQDGSGSRLTCLLVSNRKVNNRILFCKRIPGNVTRLMLFQTDFEHL